MHTLEITFRITSVFFAVIFLIAFLFCVEDMKDPKKAASARRFFFPLALSVFSLNAVAASDIWIVFVSRVCLGAETAFMSVADSTIFFSVFQVAFTILALAHEEGAWNEDTCRKMRLGSLACSLLSLGCFTHHILSAL